MSPPTENTCLYRQRLILLLPILLAALCTAPAIQAHSEPLSLSETQHEYSLLNTAEYLEDPSNSLIIEQLLAQPDKHPWRPVKGTSWSFGLSDSTYWLHFDLIAKGNRSHHHFLEVHYPLLDELDLYVTRNGHVLESKHAGDSLPFKDRPLDFRNFLFKPALPPGEKVSIYLRAKSEGAMLLPLILWHEGEFYQHEQKELLTHGIYFGILLVFAVYNLMLFFFNRERAFLYYTFYIISFGLFHASLFGLGYQYIWPNSPQFQYYSVPLFMFVALFMALRFAHHFLQLPQTCPTGVYLLRLLTLLPLLLLAALPFVAYSTIIHVGLPVILASAAVLIIISAIVWFRTRGQAGYFFFAWFIFLLAVIASTSDKLGWSGLGMVADRMLQLGLALQVIILSLALARRMQLERDTRIEAQQQTQEELSEQVKERTEELEEANRRLDAMSRTDGLTGLKNRRLFDEELEKQFRDARRNHTQLSLAMLDIDHFKRLNDKHGHLVGDDFLRLISAVIAAEVKRPMDTACRYGGEEFGIILPDTPREGVAAIAECIRSGVEAIRHKVGDEHVPVTISIGTSTLTPSQEDKPADIIVLADKALYQAKSEGRNRVVSC